MDEPHLSVVWTLREILGLGIGSQGPPRDTKQKVEITFEDVGKEAESLYGESTKAGEGGRQKASCTVRKSDILTPRLTSLSSRERWISVTRYVSLGRIYFTADWCMKEYYFTGVESNAGIYTRLRASDSSWETV